MARPGTPAVQRSLREELREAEEVMDDVEADAAEEEFWAPSQDMPLAESPMRDDQDGGGGEGEAAAAAVGPEIKNSRGIRFRIRENSRSLCRES